MKRVTGIGGIFFAASDPAALAAWYEAHLGVDVQDWGGAVFRWSESVTPSGEGTTTWSIGDGEYLKPSRSTFMINYRVEDLRGLLDVLRQEGCQVMDEIEDSEYGLFGWVMDPEGNKVELWQPPDGQ